MHLKMFLLATTLANVYTLANCLTNFDTSVKLNNLQCLSEGRFADPTDCGRYYDCVPNDNGVLVALQKSCLGHAFHSTLKACVPKQMVQGCIPYSTKSLNVADPKLKQLCTNKTNEFVCSDCKTLVICVDGVPYTDPCTYGTVCSENSSFVDAVCYPANPVECTCNKEDIFKQDYYNPSKFLSCDPEGRDSTIHICPDGLIFYEKHGTCCTENESSCTTSGVYAVKDNCNRYYTNILTPGGWLQKEYTCKNNKMFNEDTGKCEDPCTWYSGNFECEAEGRFADQYNCSKYFECIKNPLNSDSFTYIEHDCPVGYEWNQSVKNGSGHCITNGTSEKKCVPLKKKPYKCQIPNECTDFKATCETLGGQLIGQPERCLYFSSDSKAWTAAIVECASKGGELAGPLADHQAILDHAKKIGFSGWVGATDIVSDGTWVWLNGESVQVPWQSGYPRSSTSTNCLRVGTSGYQDHACHSHKYVCDLGGASAQAIRSEVMAPVENDMISNNTPAEIYMISNTNIPECVSPWIYAGHSTGCLLVTQQSMDWHSAQAYCNSMNGHLPLLDRESQRIDMMDYYQRSGLENVSFWLGANDNSGSLLWVNGMPVRDGWKYTQSKMDQGEDMCLYTYLSGQNGDPLINYCSHLLHNIICQKKVM